MAYTTIDDPAQYFTSFLWTGDGNSPRSLTGVGFQADFMWSKIRDTGHEHSVVDSVRGVDNRRLKTDSTAAEDTTNTHGHFDSLDSDGFTVTGASGYWNVNTNTKKYVGWFWKAGGSASSNSNGSITSSVSANTTAGFSIVAYTGNETAGATVGHGLGAVPQTYWVKSRSVADGWRIYHHKVSSDPETDYLVLNNNNANADSAGYWNDTAPTSSVFSLGSAGEVNTNSSTNIAYCFTEIKGYSKFGSYTGNGNADGTFVYTGFKPAWVLIKQSSASGEEWQLLDNKRNTFNPTNTALFPSSDVAENSGNDRSDFLSNGFKCRSTSAGVNASGATYIYIAFAESPFVNSNGVPNNAK
jgi:hypothetical protein